MADADDGIELSEVLHAEGELIQRNCSSERYQELLDPDFVEFGASGHVWSREEILAELSLSESRPYTMDNVSAEMIAEGIAHVTYRVEVQGRSSLRSSLWRRRNGVWRMMFHQGTRIAQPSDTLA